MVLDTGLPRSENERRLALRFSARWSLTGRILAVNIFALALLAGGFFYLDSFRTRVLDQRVALTSSEARLIAAALGTMAPAERIALVMRAGHETDQRLRVYDEEGGKLIDSWTGNIPSYRLRDPSEEPWQRHVARFLDRAIDRIVGAEHYQPFIEPEQDRLSAWPEARAALNRNRAMVMVRRAPDRTPLISAAVPLAGPEPLVLLATDNARDVIRSVRAERFRLGMLLAAVILLSVLLSLFLARTIIQPLRRLARAAQRVSQGRAREVQVPRLPYRRDEIGQLARAVSDMSLALRQRIDATEAFAADVAHELKNPLASLRSAVDSLARVSSPELQERLLTIIQDDVVRLDRLITDISEASRLDAELSRARFERIDLGTMIGGLVRTHEERGIPRNVRLAFARPRKETAMILGEGSRLARAIENLLDNAISFSPDGGLVQIAAMCDDDHVIIRIEDEGPGVPEVVREEIFNRFHSLRPDSECFGKHSGLGLAIARAIVDGHGGKIMVQDREENAAGACFEIRLPYAGEA